MTAQPIDQALKDLHDGRMIILADGVHGEAHLCVAAQRVTPETARAPIRRDSDRGFS